MAFQRAEIVKIHKERDNLNRIVSIGVTVDIYNDALTPYPAPFTVILNTEDLTRIVALPVNLRRAETVRIIKAKVRDIHEFKVRSQRPAPEVLAGQAIEDELGVTTITNLD